MNASHASLRDLYEVSSLELDTMVSCCASNPAATARGSPARGSAAARLR